MTGAGGDWLSDGLDDIAGAGCGLWVSGVDYIAGWRDASEAADQLNRALLGAGFELSAVRAVASTNEDGCGIVRLAGWPGAVRRLAGLLKTLSDGDGGAA